MKRLLIMASMLLLIASCGSKGGAGNNNSQTESPGTRPIEEVNCAVKFLKGDSLTKTALKSNQARIECALTEEQVLSLVDQAQ